VVGITRAGAEAEDIFETLVYCALKTEKASHGDKRVILPDNSVHNVEIKKVGAQVGGSANQVRAVKYQTLVIFTPARRYRWIVIPPNIVVEKIAERSRGQHSEVAFECATLSLGGWTAPYFCGDGDLEAKVLEAIEEGERYPLLKRSMELLLLDLKRTSYRARREVRRIIATGLKPEYWS